MPIHILLLSSWRTDGRKLAFVDLLLPQPALLQCPEQPERSGSGSSRITDEEPQGGAEGKSDLSTPTTRETKE